VNVSLALTCPSCGLGDSAECNGAPVPGKGCEHVCWRCAKAFQQALIAAARTALRWCPKSGDAAGGTA
jgi:hypothetical protein